MPSLNSFLPRRHNSTTTRSGPKESSERRFSLPMATDNIGTQLIASPRCNLCNGPIRPYYDHRCEVCKQAWYCTSYCRDEDGFSHIEVCQAFATFVIENPRPTPFHRLGLGLSVGGDQITLGWYEDTHIGDTPANMRVVQETLCGVENAANTKTYPISTLLKRTNPGLGCFDLDHRTEMICQEGANTEVTGSKAKYTMDINECAKRLLAEFNMNEQWKGPIAIVSRRLNDAQYLDVTPIDYRVLMNVLGVYDFAFKPKELPLGSGYRTKKDVLRDVTRSILTGLGAPMSGKIKGVLASCYADRQFFNIAEYIPQIVPRCHYVFDDNPTTISIQLGLPLLIGRLNEEPIYGQVDLIRSKHYNYCRAAKALTLITEPHLEDFCYNLHDYTDSQAGSIVVARQDLRPISCHQVEALVEFIETYVRPTCEAFNQQMATLPNVSHADLVARRRNIIKENITKERFEDWFRVFKGLKIMERSDGWEIWEKTESPLPKK